MNTLPTDKIENMPPCFCEKDIADTRDPSRGFKPHVNACVVDLLALEVSSLSISKVIQSVIKHFCDIDIPLKDLPSRQMCVNIADASHFMINEVYNEKLEKRSNF